MNVHIVGCFRFGVQVDRSLYVLRAADARHAEDVQPGARKHDDHNAGARAREAPVRQPYPSRPVHPQVSANGLFFLLQFSVLFLSDVCMC